VGDQGGTKAPCHSPSVANNQLASVTKKGRSPQKDVNLGGVAKKFEETQKSWGENLKENFQGIEDRGKERKKVCLETLWGTAPRQHGHGQKSR